MISKSRTQPQWDRFNTPIFDTINRHKRLLIVLSLLLIYLFGAHLRYEDFPHWHDIPGAYEYQGEYQMTNFDSYYYLLAARALREGTYDTLDESRRIPNGMSRPIIPPLSSLSAVLLSDIFAIPIPTIAIFFPVILAPLLGIVIFYIGRYFSIQAFFCLVAAFLTILSYSYVTRTRIGVFDTDCLNITLMYFNTWLATKTVTEDRALRKSLLAALCLTTIIYAAWWSTGSYIAILASLIPLSLVSLFKLRGHLRLWCLAGVSMATFTIILLNDVEFIGLFNILTGIQQTDFPLLDSISELEPVGLKQFIRDTAGNSLIACLMLLGFILLLYKQYQSAIYFILPFTLGFSALFMGNRFLIFSAPIFALGGAYLANLVWQQGGRYHKEATAITVSGMIALSIVSNYERLTDKLNIPAVHDSRALLNLIQHNTPSNGAIWTNWSIGYLINYYLKRDTYADGELNNGGEVLYYLSFPFAANNLKLAANFMNFYTHSDIHQLYEVFTKPADAIDFLQSILVMPPHKAHPKIKSLLDEGALSLNTGLSTNDEWLRFLYPQSEQPIYFLLHQRMLQTVSWFKQGNMDLKNHNTMGLPFILQFHNMHQKEYFIANDEMVVNQQLGLAKHRQGSMHSFSSITECQSHRCQTQYYDKDNKKISRIKVKNNNKDDRFVFHWNSDTKLGAVMSAEMSKTSFIQLFIQGKQSDHFELIQSTIPHYQLWKVHGDSYGGLL